MNYLAPQCQRANKKKDLSSSKPISSLESEEVENMKEISLSYTDLNTDDSHQLQSFLKLKLRQRKLVLCGVFLVSIIILESLALVFLFQSQVKIIAQAQTIKPEPDHLIDLPTTEKLQIKESKDSTEPKQPFNQFINYFSNLENIRQQRNEGLFSNYQNLPIPQKILFSLNIYLAGKALYEKDQIIKRRDMFHKEQMQFLGKFTKEFPELKLVKYNLQTLDLNQSEQKLALEADYERMNSKYNLSLYQQELPMCLLMTGRNNTVYFRIEYALNSVFLQNYSNYHLIVTDDASTDGGQQIYSRYFAFYGIKPEKAVLILNKKRVTALQNHLNAIFNYCKKDDIGVMIDGDDQLIGRNVLKMFNALYHKKQYGFLYSRYLRVYHRQKRVATDKIRHEYSEQYKDYQLYREADLYTFFSQIRTWRMELFYEIDLDDMKDSEGNYFKTTYDRAMFYPIVQLSCGNLNMINEYNYLYNTETGTNDEEVDRYSQKQVDLTLRKNKRYPCSKRYGGYKNRAQKRLAQAEMNKHNQGN